MRVTYCRLYRIKPSTWRNHFITIIKYFDIYYMDLLFRLWFVFVILYFWLDRGCGRITTSLVYSQINSSLVSSLLWLQLLDLVEWELIPWIIMCVIQNRPLFISRPVCLTSPKKYITPVIHKTAVQTSLGSPAKTNAGWRGKYTKNNMCIIVCVQLNNLPANINNSFT